MAKLLGRRTPKTWKHYDKYPLTAPLLAEITTPRPVVIGINWYSDLDNPVLDSQGHYWIGRDSHRLGSLRGGHCVALKQRSVGRRPKGARIFYNQGEEGACVGFGISQMLSQFNNKFYFARWTWDWAKFLDEWSDTRPGDNNGTSVSAGLDVARIKGHIVWDAKYSNINGLDATERMKLMPSLAEGIKANRWITSMDDCLQVLGYTGVGYVDIMNSWGLEYPQLTRMPVETLERLWNEDGEIGVPTDR